MTDAFWRNRALEAFTAQQWEQICDGCGKCCLHKLEDEDSGEIFYTRIACQLLDHDSCRCDNYNHRFTQVPSCIQVTPAMARSKNYLPDSCAYRLIAQGEDLPDWHPLITGDRQSTVTNGHSVAGRVLAEQYVHPDGYEEHVITWVQV